MKNGWTWVVGAALLFSMTQAARAEFYFGGGMGAAQSTANDRESQLAGHANADLSNGGYGAYQLDDVAYDAKLFGGYWLTRYLGVEAQYLAIGAMDDRYAGSQDYSQGHLTRDQRDRFEANLYGITFNGRFPTDGKLSVLAKAGLAHWRAKTKSLRTCSFSGTADPCSSFMAEQGSHRVSGTSADVGLGLMYPLSPTVALRGEWERFNKVGDANTTQTNLNLFTLSVEMKLSPESYSDSVPWVIEQNRIYYGAGVSANRASNTDTGWGGQIFIGYNELYRIERLSLDFELGYLNTGNMNYKQAFDNRVATRATGVWMSGVLRLPIENHWDLLARVGGDFGDDAGTLLGVGAGWEFTHRMQLRAEYVLRDHIDAVQMNLVYRP